MDNKDQICPVSDLEAGLDSAKRIDSSQVEFAIKNFKNYYSLKDSSPPDYSAEAFIVSPELMMNKIKIYIEYLNGEKFPEPLEENELRDLVFQLLGSNREKVSEKISNIYKKLEEEVEGIGGICIPLDGKKSFIFIKENRVLKMEDEDVLKHEVLHGMARKDSGDVGFKNAARWGRGLDEATTEILRLGEKYPGYSLDELCKMILRGEVVFAYQKEVAALLGALTLCSEENKFTIKEIAEYYFDSRPESGTLFEFEVLKRIPQTSQENIISYFDKYLN